MDIEIPEKLLKEKIIVFDIDNTLIDVTKRYRKSIEDAEINPYISLYKNSYEKRMRFWRVFLSEKYIDMDSPDEEVVELVREKYREGYGIIILTGRPVVLRSVTVRQLKNFGIPYDLLIMRPINNREPDRIFKPKIISSLLDAGLNIIEYHEDDPATISYVRSKFKDIIKVYPHNIARKKTNISY